ncbi:cytochrome P450 [Leptodontidium sp. 2 PMI_412]|nr:cytochrome P450 [Leptodontidium sp. 2 PMI_412]
MTLTLHSSYALSTGTLLVLYFVIKRLMSFINAYRFCKANGCKPARKLPQQERIIGLQEFHKQVASAKAKVFLREIQKQFQEMGNTFSTVVLGTELVMTIEPENVRAILSTNFKDYGLGKRMTSMGPLLGNGIFTSDGSDWEHSRALVRPSFIKSRVADLDSYESHIQNLIARIPTDGSSVDLQPLFHQLTLDSATEFLLGESVHCLTSPPGSPQQLFGHNFDVAQNLIWDRVRMGDLVWLTWFQSNKALYGACKFVHDYVDKFVQRALQHRHHANGDEKGKEKYIFANELAQVTDDPLRIRTELLNILLAGRDTTAGLLSNTFHVLARRSDIWAKLAQEVNELGGRKPDYETLRSMKYLKHVLNETLRLYPSVAINVRFPNKNTVLPTGGGPDGKSPLFIKKGNSVAYSVYSMHRRKDLFGEDAEEYRPERWETIRAGWEYLPFNGGPRICVGQQFALTEAGYTIVRLVQEFKSVESRDPREWLEGLNLTLNSGNGVHVAMTPGEKTTHNT